MKEFNEKELLHARSEYNKFKVLGEKNFSSFASKIPLSIFQTKMSTYFEQLVCVGYNPKRQELTAHIKINRAFGYSGDLCQNGSKEYVRFYLNYGSQWEDQGIISVNVHDIPTDKDCNKNPMKPLEYVVRLKIKPKSECCDKPVLPKVRAILAWNTMPAANSPNATYTWGDILDDTIQIIPKFCNNPLEFVNPFIKPLAADLNSLSDNLLPKVEFQSLIELYKDQKIVPSERFGYKLLQESLSTPNLEALENIKLLFTNNSLDFNNSVAGFSKLKCNTNFEELKCIGLDYHNEALVGTFRIKKPIGYNGNLCTKGSTEYVTFWIQTEECQWVKINTAKVQVHDIATIPSEGISYSAILPFNLDKLKKSCKDPQVFKIRAVLSWNSIPTSYNCTGYGNAIESYIQLQPKSKTLTCPGLIAVGGVSVGDINNTSGLTNPGATFLNSLPTFNNSPFGGIIVVQGVSCPGQKYKVQVKNLSDGSIYYLNNSFTVDDINGDPVIISSNSNNEYEYLSFHDNPRNVLASFPSVGDSLLEISIEDLSGSSSIQKIQLDNSKPLVTLNIDDNGNCTHYTQGDEIVGDFSIAEKYLEKYVITIGGLGTYIHTGGLLQSGTSLGGQNEAQGTFKIQTSAVNCGSIHLSAIHKTIWNSSYTGVGSSIEKTICLGS